MLPPHRSAVVRSSWAQLPDGALQLITARLTRDGVASVAKVWPEAVQDQALTNFVPGGIPICAECEKRIYDNSLAALIQHREPTGILLFLPELDDGDCFISEDVATLFVRALLDKGCKPSQQQTCYLCEYAQECTAQLGSEAWRALSSEYALVLATALTELYNDNKAINGDAVSLLGQDHWRCALLPYVCVRCGKLDCEYTSSCVWYCGHDVGLQECYLEMLEQRSAEVMAKSPCGCKAYKIPPAGSRRVCACQSCNSSAPRTSNCQFCRRCCRVPLCRHNGGSLKAKLIYNFINRIPGPDDST